MVSITWLEITHPVENPGIFQLEVLASDLGEEGKLYDTELYFAEAWH